MKDSTKKKGGILFDKRYSNLLSKMQQPSTILKYETLIALVKPLSTNKNVEDAIKGDYLKINARQNEVVLILLALFIL